MTATLDRSGCNASYHGDEMAYKNGGCRCPDAREAYRLYRKRHREGRSAPRRVDPTGTRRRLEGLNLLMYSDAEIAAELGFTDYTTVSKIRRSTFVYASTARRVEAACRVLATGTGTSIETQRRAAAKGWVPLWAWDDDTIDDPNARPHLSAQRLPSREDFDVVSAERALAGRREFKDLTIAERRYVVRHLVESRRWSDIRIAAHLRATDRTILRVRRQLGIPAVPVARQMDAA